MSHVLHELAAEPVRWSAFSAEVAKLAGTVEVAHNFHPVVVQPPQAKRAKFPFTGFIDFQGLKIDVENRKGEYRRGKDKDGHEWKCLMHAHYGEIRDTEGTDGDKLDVYVGPNHDSSLVVVVRQHKPDTGAFDEDKVMVGFDSVEEAVGAYKKQYDRPGFYKDGDHIAMPIGKFWRWVHDRDNHGKKVAGVLEKLALSDAFKERAIQNRWSKLQQMNPHGPEFEQELQKTFRQQDLARAKPAPVKTPPVAPVDPGLAGRSQHLAQRVPMANGAKYVPPAGAAAPIAPALTTNKAPVSSITNSFKDLGAAAKGMLANNKGKLLLGGLVAAAGAGAYALKKRNQAQTPMPQQAPPPPVVQQVASSPWAKQGASLAAQPQPAPPPEHGRARNALVAGTAGAVAGGALGAGAGHAAPGVLSSIKRRTADSAARVGRIAQDHVSHGGTIESLRTVLKSPGIAEHVNPARVGYLAHRLEGHVTPGRAAAVGALGLGTIAAGASLLHRGQRAVPAPSGSFGKQAAELPEIAEEGDRPRVPGMKMPRLATPRLNPDQGKHIPVNPFRGNWQKMGSGILHELAAGAERVPESVRYGLLGAGILGAGALTLKATADQAVNPRPEGVGLGAGARTAQKVLSLGLSQAGSGPWHPQ